MANDEGRIQVLACDKPYQLPVGASRQEGPLWLLCGCRVGHILESGSGRIDARAKQATRCGRGRLERDMSLRCSCCFRVLRALTRSNYERIKVRFH